MVELQIADGENAPEEIDDEDENENDQRILVEEVDVRRGREVLRDASGTAGSLCLVVRRPG